MEPSIKTRFETAETYLIPTIEPDEYVSIIGICIALVGILVKLFSSSNTADGSSGPANSTIWGFGLVAASIFMNMFLIRFKSKSETGNWAFIKKIISESLPSVLTLGALIWIIYLNATFFKRINQGKVSIEYTQVSYICTFLILVQVILLFKTVYSNINKGKDEIVQKLKYAVYGLTFFNSIFIAIMNVILVYFSTDG